LTQVGSYAATKGALTAVLKAAECSSRNWKYYRLKSILVSQMCIFWRLLYAGQIMLPREQIS